LECKFPALSLIKPFKNGDNQGAFDQVDEIDTDHNDQ
jgi:hypothetical protein